MKYALHAAVLLGVVWAGVKYIDGDQFRRALHSFQWGYAPLVAALGLASLFTKAWRFATMLRQTQEIERPTVMKAYIAGQSATLLPGGIAARAGLLDQVGVNVGQSSPSIALSSITDQLGFLVCGIVSALFFEAARKPVLIFLAVLGVISLVLGFEATRTWIVRLLEKVLARFKMLDHWKEFKTSMRETLSVKIVLYGVLNALLAFSFLVLALHFCMTGMGAKVSPMTLLLAFSVPTMLGRIAALPGGFGVTEVGMVGVLDHAANVTLNQAAAAVLVFRLGTVVFTALFGGIVYLLAWPKAKQKAATPTKEARA